MTDTFAYSSFFSTSTHYLYDEQNHFRYFLLSSLRSSKKQQIRNYLPIEIMVFAYAQNDDLWGQLACRNILQSVQEYFSAEDDVFAKQYDTELLTGAMQSAQQSIVNFVRTSNTSLDNPIAYAIVAFLATGVEFLVQHSTQSKNSYIGTIKQLTPQIVAAWAGNCEINIISNNIPEAQSHFEIVDNEISSAMPKESSNLPTILILAIGPPTYPDVQRCLQARLQDCEFSNHSLAAAVLIEPYSWQRQIYSWLPSRKRLKELRLPLHSGFYAFVAFIFLLICILGIREGVDAGKQVWSRLSDRFYHLFTISIESIKSTPLVPTATASDTPAPVSTSTDLPLNIPPTLMPTLTFGRNETISNTANNSTTATITNTPLPQAQTINTVSTPTTSSQPGQVNATATVASPSPTSPPSPSPESATPLPMRPGSTVPNR